jgi:hypothetical protein
VVRSVEGSCRGAGRTALRYGLASLIVTGCYTQSGPMRPADLRPAVVRPKATVMMRAGRQRVVYEARVQGDSLVGHAGDSTVVPIRRPSTRIAIPLSDVQYVTTPRIEPVRTVLMLAVTAGVVVVALFASLYRAPF